MKSSLRPFELSILQPAESETPEQTRRSLWALEKMFSEIVKNQIQVSEKILSFL